MKLTHSLFGLFLLACTVNPTFAGGIAGWSVDGEIGLFVGLAICVVFFIVCGCVSYDTFKGKLFTSNKPYVRLDSNDTGSYIPPPPTVPANV